MNDLKITLIQTHLHWENFDANAAHFSELAKKIRKGSTNIIILPEMFGSGFTMNVSKVAQPMNGPAIRFMLDIARNKNAVVCGSLVIEEKGKFYNRLIWAQPDGKIKFYDKRHLFRMAKEHKTFTGGTKKLIVDLNGWKICPLVCYDLRFPVWSRTNGDVDLLIYVANWPEKRVYAWKHLLIARAIENQCYVAGVNRVGMDGTSIVYSGESVVLDPLGMPMTGIEPGKEEIMTITLSHKHLEELRKTFPVMMDADKFKIS